MNNINKYNEIETRIPHNTNVEQVVLGGILLEPDLMDISLTRIKAKYFYKEVHRIIYEAMVELYHYKKPIEIPAVGEVLRQKNYLEAIGGISYLTSLITTVSGKSSYNYYLDIITEMYIRREGLNLTSTITELLYNGKMEDVEEKILHLNQMIENKRSVEELYIDASTIKKNSEEREYISTGFKVLDAMLSGGFRTTSLTILTGEPGSGKSTLINQILAGAIADNHKVFLYSGELPEEDLMKWFNITTANSEHIINKINSQGIDNKDVTDECWDKISKWVENNMVIYGGDVAANMRNIVASIENLVKTKDIKLFVLDNLMTLDLNESDDKYQQQKILCMKLKSLAKKHKIAIILVAHPKKPSGDSKPSMYDVSGAAEIVGIADNIIRTIRAQDKDGTQISKILLLKNRWGGIINRALTVNFDKNRRRFYSNEYEYNRDYKYDSIV